MSLLPADALIEERQLDILRRRLEPYQIVGLEYESDHLVPVFRRLGLTEVPDETLVDAVLA